MRGDILLYRTGGILKDRVVCAYTGGPFCHCEIDLGDGTTVGAHSEDGITRGPERMFDRKVVISLQGETSPERIEAGIAWALEHEGEPFSWASIADLVVPTWVSTLVFGRRSAYNCASLVAQYLEIAGGLDLPSGKRPQALASPNAIARAAGLLPRQRGLTRTGVIRLGASMLALLPIHSPAPQRPIP
jgi:uncharacterized protein YycO